ncbi:peptidoglycan editing factor PgeF [Cesiribacter andamanensis]|uniref:peptidoglycan editing factor PgeF n=1 Tax=Cesiribacter andamanensis TaxID=649507 RepID=UPI000344F1E5|nr:peptidoglycan editing factor PgeF [Cesiribacter andamanensis]
MSRSKSADPTPFTLPPYHQPMKRINPQTLPLWQFDQLAAEPGIRHFVSERSTPNEEEFTLSYSSSPDREAVRSNRRQLAVALGLAEDRLYFPSQVHQTRIVAVSSQTTAAELQETDALITQERGIGLAVLSADCVPILLYDRRHGAVGAVHSGWRGTVARILEKTLLEMQARFGTRGEDLLAGIGPSVCQEAYEVGQEVVQAVEEAFGSQSRLLLLPQPDEKARLDLWKANVLQLEAFGVPQQQIELAKLCTVQNNARFSRPAREIADRFAAGIQLR